MPSLGPQFRAARRVQGYKYFSGVAEACQVAFASGRVTAREGGGRMLSGSLLRHVPGEGAQGGTSPGSCSWGGVSTSSSFASKRALASGPGAGPWFGSCCADTRVSPP